MKSRLTPGGLTPLYSFAVISSLACSALLSAQTAPSGKGPRVIAYDARATAPANWKLDATPLIRIGGTSDASNEFSEVLGIARLRDGRIVVADGGTSEIRVFSPAGKLLRTMGRKGQGPGEFGNGIQYMIRSSDTVVVHDRQSRLQFFTGDGTLIRSYARPIFTGHGVSSWPGVLGDGAGVVQGVDPTPPQTSEQVTQTASLGLVRPGETEARAFTQIPVFERVSRNGQSVGLFLGAVSRVAVMGARICAGYTIKWEIQCFDKTGAPLSVTRRAVTPGAVTPADIKVFKDGYAAANKNQPTDKVAEALEKLQFARDRSAFGRFVPSSNGELWIGEFVVLESFIPGRRGPAVSEKSTKWTVLGADGAWIADVVLPPRFSLLDAGADYVAGTEVDTDGVENVAVYRFRR